MHFSIYRRSQSYNGLCFPTYQTPWWFKVGLLFWLFVIGLYFCDPCQTLSFGVYLDPSPFSWFISVSRNLRLLDVIWIVIGYTQYCRSPSILMISFCLTSGVFLFLQILFPHSSVFYPFQYSFFSYIF